MNIPLPPKVISSPIHQAYIDRIAQVTTHWHEYGTGDGGGWSGSFCGNKVCEAGETTVNCLIDCPKKILDAVTSSNSSSDWIIYGTVFIIIVFLLICMLKKNWKMIVKWLK